ncbi:MAG: cache domain-containing protein [Planctomycetota bacterium]|nr:cache domain-containing protein [Planctomycetota bacterium]MDI6787728.1 cache domain-containing protein [Planctomycetota bacterium]
MFSLRTKVIISLVIVVIITGAIATIIGVYLIGEGIVKQAQDKVRTDLNSAREIYLHELNNVKTIVRLTAERFYIRDALIKNDLEKLYSETAAVREREELDILTVLDKDGRVILRPRNPSLIGDDQTHSPIVRKVLTEKESCAGTEIITKEEMVKCSSSLVEQAYFRVIPTPHAKPTDKTEETAGMVIKAAAPILDYDGNLLGLLYGANLINRNYKIVDKIKETVFQGQMYKGKEIGTATIFQGDLRVSTNVKTKEGERAIGTRIAADVGEQVLVKCKPWIERAFVVTDWYFTAYEPIRDLEGSIIGILYVGILESKFTDKKKETIWLLVTITVIGIIIAFIVAYFLVKSITSPLGRLVNTAHQLAKGDFNQAVGVNSEDEIGKLSKAFNFMISSIKERDEKLKQHTQEVVVRSERLAMIGQLAAGVAHEINNPLAGLRTYVKLLNKEITDLGLPESNFPKYLSLMERETIRCSEVVRNLLNFARQTDSRPQLVDINHILNEALSFIEHQIIMLDLKVEKNYSTLPQTIADFSQLQQVFMNIVLNACESMSSKGTLSLSTRHLPAPLSLERGEAEDNQIEVKISDTGSGIAQEILPHIFEPFFTTKKKGTGLGLSVAYGIITQHKGTIEVDSVVGSGTAFIVKIPVQKP